MNTIYKYELFVKEVFEIQLPEGFEILAVHEQNGRSYMWVSHDLSKPKKSVRFTCKGTGFRYDPNDIKYIGTTFSVFEFVWHFFMYTEDDKTA